MKTLALVLASLCVIAQATSVFQAPAFLEIKQSPFGNAVASMIQMNLETENPSNRLNQINDLLNQVEESLEKQSADAEADISNKRGYCKDTNDFFVNWLNGVESYLADLKSEEQNLLNEQSTKTSELANERNAWESNKAEQEKTTQQIEDENAAYTARNAEYEEAINACEQALVLLSKLQTSGAVNFAQVKSKFNGIITLLEKHVAKKTSSLIQPVLNVLAELSTGAQEVDQAKLGKIINLINQLLAELRQQKDVTTSNHNTSIEGLTAILNSLEAAIANNEKQIENLETRLTAIQNRLDQLAGLIKEASDLIVVLKKSLEDLTNECNNYETVYSAEKTERDSQKNLLDQLKEYFHSQVVPSVTNVRDDSYEDVLTH